jgi:hypothetical protein
MEILSAVKFATLHNNQTIFYSHISHIHEVFEKINKLNHNVILITGNCDPPVTSFVAPSNVKYWFAQNCLSSDSRTIPIPIGLRNPFPYEIENQFPILSGASYQNGQFCEEVMKDIYLNDDSHPSKFLYTNFNERTNLGYRSVIKKISVETPFIDYENPLENVDGYNNYYSKILDHQSTICPIGNGIDTHRIWEVLYCKRIPITINSNCYKYPRANQNKDILGEGNNIPPQEDEYGIYTKLYSQLPIVILNSYQQLLDKNYLEKMIELTKKKTYNFDLLDFNYWKNLILDLEKSLNL